MSRSFEDIEARIAALGQGGSEAVPAARELLALGEEVLETWIAARGDVPTDELKEGFRILALHRQGAKGDPSFNACRETCREIVYLRNVVTEYDGDMPEARHSLRLQSMVVKHLALFVGGKMVEAGLGDFCCSSRPIRHSDAAAAGPTIQGD